MQTALTYRTNRDLFSNYYLDEHLPETEAWDELSDDELREAKADIMDLWEREQGTAPKRNESQLEEKFIRPMFRKLGIPFEVEESTSRTQRRPDYGFFESEDAARGAFERREEGGDFYKDAVAVADAKRWGRPLDTRGSGEHERDFENPSYQIHVYLQETPARWAVLTDGKKWRLYYGPTSHRLDSYYEIDLPTVLEQGDLEDFKYFYLFFRHGAFLEDSSGECFLDEVYDESNVFAQELGEDLQDNIYEAIKVLSEGFMQYPDNDLSEDDLNLIHDSSLIYLYRLIFVLYAESEGRDLLDTTNEIYEESYSLNSLKQDIAEELDSSSPKYRDWQDNLWDRLDELFKLIDQGSKSRGIPEDDLYIPAYNGGLFRTNPDEDDSVEARFLANHQVGDAYLAEVIELLTRSQNGNGGGKIFVDYSSLDVRHLGSIYEGLLEYQLDVADEPLALEDGEYVPAGEGDEVIVEEGEVHLTTGSGERKATGSYYTPEYVVEYIVEETVGPLVDDIRGGLVGQSAFDEGGFAEEFAEEVFDLKILDPAMGSGHFLTSAIDYLAREIIDAQERQAAQQGIETVDEDHDINWARRQVAQRCIYGVDLNPLAVELAKVSLWLRTLAAEQPLAFLDHHLKTGNSLVGSDIEEIEELESDAGGGGQNATLADFGVARKGTIEQLMRIYQDFIAIENQDLADVKEMEAKYDEFERNKLRQRLEAMTNVHTAEKFGLDNLPSDAYKRMAAALEDDSEWENIEQSQWFRDAQTWAAEDQYFHWKLEYPEVFYNTSGEEKANSGFDAVIGNPPYIRSRNLPDAHKDFYKEEYRSAEGAYDIYIPFLEQAAALGEQNSFIIPNKWTTTDYGETIRDLLIDEYSLRELVDVSHLDVFPDADIYPLIISYSPDGESDLDGPTIRHVEDSSNISNTDGVTVSSSIINQLGGRVIPVNLTPEFAPIIEKALARDTRLGDHIQMTEAIHTGNVRDKLVVEEEVDGSCEKLADGKSIDRYQVDWSGQYIRYDEGLINGDEGEYGDLRERELFDRDEKLFIRDISYRPVAAYDDSQLFALNTLYSVTQLESSNYSLKFLLAVFNSEFVNRYFRQVYGGTHVSGDYLRFKPMFSYNIPVPNPNQDELLDDYAQEFESIDADVDTTSIAAAIGDLTDVIRNAKDIKTSLNLNIVDFLGEYSEGQQLADLSGYQPPKGVSDSPLSETASSLENLRVGSIDVAEEGNTVTIHISARYKPEDPDEFETDRWDYTETELMPAMEFIGLSDEQRLLIREFVPYAIEEAGGFAGFRETATKTNSLIDRLEELTLPAISDVTSELSRYQNQIQKAEQLDKKIEIADELLDEIIYDLYGLSSDERAIVEKHRE
jgi:type II restriction/modification system DNA methylase subunit YeeA